MAQDFRDLLKEKMRNPDVGERWFEDFEIGCVFYFSVQASALHESTPSALLDDISGYTAFQVTLQARSGVFTYGKRGAWQHLENTPWWHLFEPESPLLLVAPNVPTATVQQILEDLHACVEAHPEMAKRKCQRSLSVC